MRMPSPTIRFAYVTHSSDVTRFTRFFPSARLMLLLISFCTFYLVVFGVDTECIAEG